MIYIREREVETLVGGRGGARRFVFCEVFCEEVAAELAVQRHDGLAVQHLQAQQRAHHVVPVPAFERQRVPVQVQVPQPRTPPPAQRSFRVYPRTNRTLCGFSQHFREKKAHKKPERRRNPLSRKPNGISIKKRKEHTPHLSQRVQRARQARELVPVPWEKKKGLSTAKADRPL